MGETLVSSGDGNDYIAGGIAEVARYGNRVATMELSPRAPLSPGARDRLLAEGAISGVVLDPELDDPILQLMRNPRNRVVRRY